jgi:hypothetical protein
MHDLFASKLDAEGRREVKTKPGNSATGESSESIVLGDQRLAGTPVEDVRQATTRAAEGSANHAYIYSSKTLEHAQYDRTAPAFGRDAVA